MLGCQKGLPWDLPGGPVVQTRAANAGGLGSILGWGTKIPNATKHGQEIFKKERSLARQQSPVRINLGSFE